MISALPDGVSDNDTPIPPQERAHPLTPSTPLRPNAPDTTDPTDTPARQFRKPRCPPVYPRGERKSSLPPRPDVPLSKSQTIDDMFAKELLKKENS